MAFLFWAAVAAVGTAVTLGGGTLGLSIFNDVHHTDYGKRDVQMLLEGHPLLFKYEGRALKRVDEEQLRHLSANITSTTTAIFDAPGWKHPVEGDFMFDETKSDSSILRGNFSFLAPPALTTSISAPSKVEHVSEKIKIPILPRSDGVAEKPGLGETITSAVDSLLSFGSRLGDDIVNLVHNIGHNGEEIAGPTSKRATQEEEPIVISGQWITYPPSLDDSSRKDIFDSFYEHIREDTHTEPAKGVNKGIELKEYTEFLSQWDEQCLEERFPLCCSPGGLCV